MRSRCSDRKVHAAQVPTQGQLENLRGKGGLGELSPHPVQDEVPTSALWTYRPGVSLPTQPVTRIGSGGGGGGGRDRGVVLVKVGGGDEKRGEKKLDWVAMGRGVGMELGQLLIAPAFHPALGRCLGLRRYPPPHTHTPENKANDVI